MILAILNQKGGVGKTTTAVTLAHALALDGMRTLLVDLDAQGNVADALGVRKTNGLYHLLLVDSQAAITYSIRPYLDAVLSDKTTVAAKQILAGKDFREYALRDALDAIAPNYAMVILDVAPGADILQIAAMVAATHILIPVALDHLAVIGASDALGTIASLQKVGAYRAEFLGVLPTFWERTTNESHQQLLELVHQFGELVWPPIPTDVKLREAPAHGQTIWEYAPHVRSIHGVRLTGEPKEGQGGYLRVLHRLQRHLLPSPSQGEGSGVRVP